MNSNYVAEIQSLSLQVSQTSNLCPLTCIRIQVARPGYMFPGDMCPGVNEALYIYAAVVSGIIAAVILVISLLITLVLRKRLLIAIALIKESSRFVRC